MRLEVLHTDILILGGGAAGCYAALSAARRSDAKILLVEKAGIARSGCLAAGINAVNAYIGEGRSPEDYVDYALNDAEGIARADLLRGMAARLNDTVRDLEELGLVILKDSKGRYASRGWRNIKIHGENLKPLLAKAVREQASVSVLERVNVFSLLVRDNAVFGAVAFSVKSPVVYILCAPVVICATGGAAGLYLPNSSGTARHAMWYPPCNTGAGYAMGITAGAEMTSFEMRFVALRCKGTLAPTGTLALGLNARQVNRLGQVYEDIYGTSTSRRAYGTWRENHEGRGPCVLRAEHLSQGQLLDLCKAYLNMAPLQALKLLEDGILNAEAPAGGHTLEVPVECTEPYIVGGHAASGYWIDEGRETTVRGLFAAGDAAGGCPQKYAGGAMAEAAIAASSALEALHAGPRPARDAPHDAQPLLCELRRFFDGEKALFTARDLEDAMQRTMDEYAGGIGADYAFSSVHLDRADARIGELSEMCGRLRAADMRELLRICELRERLVVCRSVIAHLRARRETRWPGFARNLDYPHKDAAWQCCVNSKLENGKLRIILRELSNGEVRA